VRVTESISSIIMTCSADLYTSAYVSIRQHASAYFSVRHRINLVNNDDVRTSSILRWSFLRQYLYFCTHKACKLRTCSPTTSTPPPRPQRAPARASQPRPPTYRWQRRGLWLQQQRGLVSRAESFSLQAPIEQLRRRYNDWRPYAERARKRARNQRLAAPAESCS
jgi:hypothetical protein